METSKPSAPSKNLLFLGLALGVICGSISTLMLKNLFFDPPPEQALVGTKINLAPAQFSFKNFRMLAGYITTNGSDSDLVHGYEDISGADIQYLFGTAKALDPGMNPATTFRLYYGYDGTTNRLGNIICKTDKSTDVAPYYFYNRSLSPTSLPNCPKFCDVAKLSLYTKPGILIDSIK